MANKIEMLANTREKAGKGSSRAVRRTGNIPAVIYGGKETPVMITIEEKFLVKELHKGTLFTLLCDLKTEKDSHLVLARDVQLDPVTDRPVHVDFLRVTERTKIKVQVPVNFINQEASEGLSQGGMLNIISHEVELLCRATKIPESVDVDLTGCDLGDSVPFSKLQLPEGAVPSIEDDTFTIATIVAPSALKSEEDEEAEAAEGEEASAEGESEEAKSE